MSKYFVGIAGNIGVGKTTLTDIIARHFQWKPFYESVIDNPYLDDFYRDMERWSFHLQIYFLHHRFKAVRQMTSEDGSCVQDRTIYEDVEIFARNLYEMGHMSKRDWDNYRELFGIMVNFLKKPDLIIYLRASIDTLITRIKSRGRGFEKGISADYLFQLNTSYERWVKKLKNELPVLVIETDGLNILKDEKGREKILSQISRFCPE